MNHIKLISTFRYSEFQINALPYGQRHFIFVFSCDRSFNAHEESHKLIITFKLECTSISLVLQQNFLINNVKKVILHCSS
jgi:hypothetical protein